jgi:hypothetical protein
VLAHDTVSDGPDTRSAAIAAQAYSAPRHPASTPRRQGDPQGPCGLGRRGAGLMKASWFTIRGVIITLSDERGRWAATGLASWAKIYLRRAAVADLATAAVWGASRPWPT